MIRLGVLVSGSGTNLQALIDRIDAGLPAEIVLVVSSRPDAYGITRAQQAGIPALVLSRSDYTDPLQADATIVQALQDCAVDYILMAGYMRKVTSVLLDAFPNRVVNLHPALLPSFRGAHAIDDAFTYGVKITGVTVHFANEDYDTGPIIAQRAVPVLEDDTLASLEERIHDVEHELYPTVVEWLVAGRIAVDDSGKVTIDE